MNLSWRYESKAEGFSSNTSKMLNPHHGSIGIPGVKSVTGDNLGIVVKEGGCYVCGRIEHMKRNYRMYQRQQGIGRGIGRSTSGVIPFSGSMLVPSPMANASRPAATQATIQQPWTEGRAFAMTQ